MTRGQLGRSAARVELAVVAFSGFVLAPFLYLAAPAWHEPMFVGPNGDGTALTGIAVVGFLIGFAWMVRIYRASPEPDQRAWRYREQD
jgi:hypothetical protein